MPLTNCARCSVLVRCKVCAQCRVAYYCSGKCQKAHWKAHRDICKVVVRAVGTRPVGDEKDLERQMCALMADTAFVENIVMATVVSDTRMPRVFFIDEHFIVVSLNIDVYMALGLESRRDMIIDAASQRVQPDEVNIRMRSVSFDDPYSKTIIGGIPEGQRPPVLDGMMGIVCEAYKGGVDRAAGKRIVSKTLLFNESFFLGVALRTCGLDAARVDRLV